MKTNTDSSKSSKSSRLPISKKAYADFAARITETFTRVFHRADLCDEGINVLDRYLQGEEVAQNDCSMEVYVAFLMIRPEIDKACRRSAAARQRAALRRQAASTDVAPLSKTSDVVALASSDAGNTASVMDYPLNRRVRREIEREEARELRRELRRQKRRR